jgi:chromate reductase, NAD(P)H dehydrogenase (quinone)
MTTHKVGYLIGSLSEESINCTLSKALIRLAPRSMQLSEIPIGTLPLYNRDLDDDMPQEARALKQAIADVDAILYITPEYNRSIPGVLKNAIDWASRPYGENALARKASATIGTSPGAIGTAVAQQHLKSILSYCNSPQMNAIEAYIQFKPDVFGDDGSVSDQETEEFLRTWMEEFNQFIARVLQVLPPDED